MDKSIGQGVGDDGSGRGAGSRGTREKLMAAAAELIGEVGWGRVTTRAVAERAGLPHGSVSYHFRGKQELLIEACMFAFGSALPVEDFSAPASIDEMLTLIADEIRAGVAQNRAMTRLMFEALREAERDDALRERMGGLLETYRQIIVDLVRTDRGGRAGADGLTAEGVATLLGAVGDGLLMHALIDPNIDVTAALEALRVALTSD